MQQNPRISIKEIGVSFYYFYQMILKKQNKKTQAVPLVRNKETRAFPVLFPHGPCLCDLYL